VPFDGALSPLHWLVIVAVAFLVLGPRELPQLAKQVGRGVRELKRIQQHLGAELGDLAEGLDAAPSAEPPSSERDDANHSEPPSLGDGRDPKYRAQQMTARRKST
jgi:sec-independent protein translocase protein TatA